MSFAVQNKPIGLFCFTNHSIFMCTCLLLFCFLQNSATDTTEVLAGNISSSHVAAETVAVPTQQNHLSLSGRSLDSVSMLT